MSELSDGSSKLQHFHTLLFQFFIPSVQRTYKTADPIEQATRKHPGKWRSFS